VVAPFTILVKIKSMKIIFRQATFSAQSRILISNPLKPLATPTGNHSRLRSQPTKGAKNAL
jgi:hypothetical protein